MNDSPLYILDASPHERVTELRSRLHQQHGVSTVVLSEIVLDRVPLAESFAPSSTFLWRLKNRPPHTNAPELLRSYFVEQEWRNALLGLNAQFPGRVINDPVSAERAGSKPLQLEVAHRVGLTTPRTLITNDRAALSDFVAANAPTHTIIKPLDTTFMGNPDRPGDTLFVGPRPVTTAELAEVSDEQMRTTPVIAQTLVVKEYELRVIVYGSHACFVKIDSQRHAASSLDWRMRQADASMFSVLETDRSLAAMLTSYLHELGLYSGVFDLAVTPEGQSIFFECNANGEWMAIDQFVHGAIVQSVAEALAELHGSAAGD
jgi:glutathione synthase/RimK-type ligase-like ATP-grasp enzyme